MQSLSLTLLHIKQAQQAEIDACLVVWMRRMQTLTESLHEPLYSRYSKKVTRPSAAGSC